MLDLYLHVALVSCLAAAPSAQAALPRHGSQLPEIHWPRQGRGTWYSGDTHEHVQNCNGTVFTPAMVLDRMHTEGLNVANLLIWDPLGLPFTQFVCAVTGEPESVSTSTRVMQYGIETSGLQCAKWGHLVGLGIGPEQARIASGSVAEGACADMPGLGLGCAGGDGTGVLNAPISEHFATASGAVMGYAHTAWPLNIHHPEGYDWNTELLATGFTTDARYLDPALRLSFPDLQLLFEPTAAADLLDHDDEDSIRGFSPILGPMDAVLGEAQFFETTYMGLNAPVQTIPPANWFGLYYKLLSAGMRTSITAGSDRACPLPNVEHPQTSVSLVDGLTYDGWIRGVAKGRTTLGIPRVRLELLLGGRDIGDQLQLESPDASTTAVVQLVCGRLLQDNIELVVNGLVVRSVPVSIDLGGTERFTFEDVTFDESSWVAVRLSSQRAHSAAIYVIVDGKPIADGRTAEYWMMWCDAVAKRVLDRPDLEVFACQETLAFERLARARRAFQTLRDIDGFDPAWDVTRRGISTGACRGPISSGVSGPVVAGQPFRLTCVNAPPLAQGVAYVSRASVAGDCVGGATRYISTLPPDLVDVVPVIATRSGYAEVIADAPAAGASVLHAQFVWQATPDCPSSSCDGSPTSESASDALELVVH